MAKLGLYSKCNALGLACAQQNLAAVHFMLEVTFSSYKNTMDTLLLNPSDPVLPLFRAISSGKVDIPKALLEFEKQHTNAIYKASGTGGSSFESKQFTGNMLCEGIKVLKEYDICCLLEIAHPADINATDYLYSTPIHLACLRGYGGVVQILVGLYGANFNVRDFLGHSPAFIAFVKRHQGILDYLRTQGAYIDFFESGRNPPPRLRGLGF